MNVIPFVTLAQREAEKHLDEERAEELRQLADEVIEQLDLERKQMSPEDFLIPHRAKVAQGMK